MAPLSKDVVEDFHKNGLAIVKGFASKEQCAEMMKRMGQLIEEWDPATSANSAFKCAKNVNITNEYFFDSADKIRFFLEPKATNEEGMLKPEISKELAVHKVGHALHWLDPVFREYSCSTDVLDLATSLGYKSPVLPQSMYIFKQPRIGDPAVMHQDSTFLHTTPRCSCLGMWLALEDATEENGCLWGKPGSHNGGVRRLFVRNPDYFEKGDKTATPIVFEPIEGVEQNPDEGEAFNDNATARAHGYVPYPVQAGDLVLIHGEVDHLSFSNSSDKSRHSYQLHMVEGGDVEWSPRNWMQYPEGKEFPKLGQKETF